MNLQLLYLRPDNQPAELGAIERRDNLAVMDARVVKRNKILIIWHIELSDRLKTTG